MSAENRRVLLDTPVYLWAIRRDGATEDEYILTEALELKDVRSAGGAIDSPRAPIRGMQRIGRFSYVVVSGEDESVLSIPLVDDEAAE